MYAGEPEALYELHNRPHHFEVKTDLHNCKQIFKRKGGYLQAKKVITTEIPVGTLVVDRTPCTSWNETRRGMLMRVSLYPAYQSGEKAWILSYVFDPGTLPVNERILDYETGKELWLKHSNTG